MASDTTGGMDFESVNSTPLMAPSLSLQGHFAEVKGQSFQEGVTPSVEGPANTAPVQVAQAPNIVQNSGIVTGKGNGGPVEMTVHSHKL